MESKVAAAINQIEQLQQAFSSKLAHRIAELNQASLELDKQLPPFANKNKQLLKTTYELAHKLAGSAGTFQFTDVYTMQLKS